MAHSWGVEMKNGLEVPATLGETERDYLQG